MATDRETQGAVLEPFWVMGPARRLVITDGEAVSKRGASGKPLKT